MQKISPAEAKVEMKRRGHSCRSSAKHLGKSYQWVCNVLNGRGTSRPLIKGIFKLPIRQKRKGGSK
jgi:hypothetical protein